MDEDDDTKPYPSFPSVQSPSPENAKSSIPNAPKTPGKFQKMPSRLMSNKGLLNKQDKINESISVSSGLTKEEALQEIDSLQKTILGLQTEKEFMRSTYERAASVCQDIEDRITVMQKKVNNLQDEFGIGTFIEDDEARKLMVDSAMKSCEDALTRVRLKQDKLSEEAMVEHRRIIEARQKIGILKGNDTDPETEKRDLELLRDNIKAQLLNGSYPSVTMSELAEKLDELVDKVIVLESAVSSQNASVNRLRTEADALEEAIITGGQNLEMEFERIQKLDENVKTQNVNLQIHIIEASCSYDHLSDKLQTVKPDEDDVMFMDVRPLPSAKPVHLPQLSMEEKIINLMKPDSHHQRDQKGGFPDFSANLDSHSHETIIQEPAEAKSNLTQQFSFSPAINHHENTNQVHESSNEEDKNANEFEEWFKEQDKKHQEDIKQQLPNIPTANHHENTVQVEEWFPYTNTANHHENTLQVQDWFKVEDDKQQVHFSPTTNHNDDGDDVPNWRELFLSGLEDREKNLLKEYTSVLRNFKEAKKKLNEMEKKNNDSLFKTSVQIKTLMNANALKDAEIKFLHQKLNLFQSCLDETTADQKQDHEFLLVEEEEQQQQDPQVDLQNEEEGKMMPEDEQPLSNNSAIEEKLRTDIDGLLEENIEFWLRFSTSFHQITKFQASVKDLQAEFLRIKERVQHGGNNNNNNNNNDQTVSSDLRPIYKHLKEIQTELALWVEHNSLLEDDLQNRVTSLGEIQQEIVRVSNSNEESKEEGVVELNGYQAAKFQGEVINMKQENNKVVHELQVGLDHVKKLQVEIKRTISELEEVIGISSSKGKAGSRSKIPLRSLLFGARLKKQKPSLFQCLTPTLQKQYSDLRSRSPPPPPPSSSSPPSSS